MYTNLYLNSQTTFDDDDLKIPKYNFIREDNQFNSKRGGVCVYYKNSLPFKVMNLKYLQENISFELKVEDICCKFICLYSSPSQTWRIRTILKEF